MTLKPFDAENLDQLALSLLDIASIARNMAKLARDNKISDVALHDKKAAEWIQNLNRWIIRAQSELKIEIADARPTD
jgi:hypothetical protein